MFERVSFSAGLIVILFAIFNIINSWSRWLINPVFNFNSLPMKTVLLTARLSCSSAVAHLAGYERHGGPSSGENNVTTVNGKQCRNHARGATTHATTAKVPDYHQTNQWNVRLLISHRHPKPRLPFLSPATGETEVVARTKTWRNIKGIGATGMYSLASLSTKVSTPEGYNCIILIKLRELQPFDNECGEVFAVKSRERPVIKQNSNARHILLERLIGSIRRSGCDVL